MTYENKLINGMTMHNKSYTLHPTWNRKLRLILYDNPTCMCPYCGYIDIYWENTCLECGKPVTSCREVLVDG